MNLKHCFATLFLLLVISQPLLASEERYGADFLQQLTSAQANGVGGSRVAYSIGAQSLNNNPAGLAFAKENELIISFYRSPRINAYLMKENEDGRWLDYAEYDIKPSEMEFVSYSLPLGRLGNLGFGFVFRHSGRFIRVDKEGKARNTFPRNDMAFTLGYSVKLPGGASTGIDAKSIRSKVPTDEGDSIGRTYAIDIGFMHQTSRRARVGAVLQNVGKKLSFNDPDIPDNLRSKLLIGASYILKDNQNSRLLLNTDINPPFEDGLRYNFGIELLYADRLALRIGYMRSIETYHDPLTNLNDGFVIDDSRVWMCRGLTIGLGLRLKDVEVNLARSPGREPTLNDDEKLRLEDQESITSFSFIARF